MVEPHLGYEYAYNRWYEDDHYYAGALYMPWMFAGRRFVATRELQLLRYPEESIIAQPVTAGCYLHLFWITSGHVEDHVRWSVSTNQELRAGNRILLDRTHVYTAFQDYLGAVARDTRGPKDFQSLNYPYNGLVMEVVDAAAGSDRITLDGWLDGVYLPWVQRTPDSPVAQTLRFAPQPLPEDKMPDVADVPGIERRVTLLHFLDDDPRANWQSRFAGNGEMIERSGAGHLRFAAPFIPVLHGTDRYVDQLR
jgi:hypothetical protein